MGNSVSHCEAVAEEPTPVEVEQASPEAVAEQAEAEAEPAPAEEEAEEEEEEEAAPEIKVGTAPLDFRFPAVNQARTCYTHYNEFYKCVEEKGEDADECKYHRRFFKSMCPNEWVENWEELRSEGRWYGKY